MEHLGVSIKNKHVLWDDSIPGTKGIQYVGRGVVADKQPCSFPLLCRIQIIIKTQKVKML